MAILKYFEIAGMVVKDSAMSRHIINQRMHNARGAEQPPDDWSNSVDAESSRETLRSRLTQAPWRLLVEIRFVEGGLGFLFQNRM